MKIRTLVIGSLLTLSIVVPVGAAGVVDIGQSGMPDCAAPNGADLDMSMAMAGNGGLACATIQPAVIEQPVAPLSPTSAAPVATDVAAVAPEDDYVFPAPYPGFRSDPVQLIPQPAVQQQAAMIVQPAPTPAPAPVRPKVVPVAVAAQPVDLIPSPRLSATVTTAELRGPVPSARRELTLESLWVIGAYR